MENKVIIVHSFLTMEDFEKPLHLTPEEDQCINAVILKLQADIERERKRLLDQKLQQIQELNRSPLSQAVKPLLWQPSERELYLVQAAEQALDLLANYEIPMPEMGISREEINVLEELLPGMRTNPQAFKNLTEPNPEWSTEIPHSPEEILKMLNNPGTDWKEKTSDLLKMLVENMQENGFNLEPSLSFTRDRYVLCCDKERQFMGEKMNSNEEKYPEIHRTALNFREFKLFGKAFLDDLTPEQQETVAKLRRESQGRGTAILGKK